MPRPCHDELRVHRPDRRFSLVIVQPSSLRPPGPKFAAVVGLLAVLEVYSTSLPVYASWHITLLGAWGIVGLVWLLWLVAAIAQGWDWFRGIAWRFGAIP